MPTSDVQTLVDRAAAALRPMLALSGRDKREALRMLPKLASLSPAFLGRFPKLFVPKFLLRR